VQDFFQLGLVPADTDYRMFSASMQGWLPGLDTAFLLGAGMYHTDRDAIENIRPGTIQVCFPYGRNRWGCGEGRGWGKKGMGQSRFAFFLPIKVWGVGRRRGGVEEGEGTIQICFFWQK